MPPCAFGPPVTRIVKPWCPQLYEFGANLRSTSPFDAGAPTKAGVSGYQKGENTRYSFSCADCNSDSGIGKVDHVAWSHRKPSIQANPRIRTTFPSCGLALMGLCTSKGKHCAFSDAEPRRCEDRIIPKSSSYEARGPRARCRASGARNRPTVRSPPVVLRTKRLRTACRSRRVRESAHILNYLEGVP
jgi:hypothetical protein